MNLRSHWAAMPPAKRRIFAVVGIVAGVLMILAVVQQEPEREQRYNKRTDQVQSVFTDRSNRNASIDALAGQIKQLREETHRILEEQRRIISDNTRRLDNQQELMTKRGYEYNQRFGDMSSEFRSTVESAIQDSEAKARAREENAVAKAKEESDRLAQENAKLASEKQDAESALKAAEKDKAKLEKDAEKRTVDRDRNANREALDGLRRDRDRNKAQVPDNAKTLAQADPSNPFAVAPVPQEKQQPGARKAQPLRLSVISEPEKEDRSKKIEKKDAADRETDIPAGSILTGTIITGGDFPTNKGAFDQPTPLLIRISKEAILPNRFRSDIRECFLLAGGAGDLASERAKLRGESLSCVRRDGSVIETNLDSYVTGEDGKEGVKGRVVSKQGQFIARSLMSGFLGGMSEAFDVNPVPVLATTSTGETQYDDVFSDSAMQGAAVKGASDALDRLAQFYLDMAEEIFPVIEINAGRQVDVVVIQGTSLRISAKGSINTNKGRK